MRVITRPDRIARQLVSSRETKDQLDLPNTQDNFESFVYHSRHELLHSITVTHGVNPDNLACSTNYIEILLEIFGEFAISVLIQSVIYNTQEIL